MPKRIKKLRRVKIKNKHKSAVQSAREQEYYKVRSRIQHRMSEYRTKGYDVSNINVPPIPKRITEKSINRLNKITTEYIRRHSTVAISMDISTGEVTKRVSGEKYFREQQKVSRIKASQTRKRRKAAESDSYDYSYDSGYSDAPHIGDLMMNKIENLIAQYNVENSSLASTIKGWLDDAKDAGVIDRLSQLTSDMLNDLEEDIRYVSQGKQPKYNGTNALHWSLMGKNLSAEEWRGIQEGYEQDAGANQYDEESFYGYIDDEDDY